MTKFNATEINALWRFRSQRSTLFGTYPYLRVSNANDLNMQQRSAIKTILATVFILIVASGQTKAQTPIYRSHITDLYNIINNHLRDSTTGRGAIRSALSRGGLSKRRTGHQQRRGDQRYRKTILHNLLQ